MKKILTLAAESQAAPGWDFEHVIRVSELRTRQNSSQLVYASVGLSVI